MVGDPNWLYTTIAQASAAIVAIVGGFITATVLMLTSEKRSLTHQLTDKETRLAALKFKEGELLDTYETMKVDKFFNRITDDLKKEDELPPLEVLMQRYPGWNLNHKILKREYEKLSKHRLEAREFIEQHSDKIDPTKFVLFDEWIKENNLDISSYDYELLEEEYERFRAREEEILEERKKEAEEQRRKAAPPYLRGIFELQEGLRAPMLNFAALSPKLTQYNTLYELYRHQKEDRRLEETEMRLNSLRHEIFLLESEANNLDARLRAFSYPPNLRWGIVVLSYLAGVSIIFPVMVISNEAYSPDIKKLVIGLFISGLAAIFAYIVSQFRILRR